jgi:hypothetical protein
MTTFIQDLSLIELDRPTKNSSLLQFTPVFFDDLQYYDTENIDTISIIRIALNNLAWPELPTPKPRFIGLIYR